MLTTHNRLTNSGLRTSGFYNNSLLPGTFLSRSVHSIIPGMNPYALA